MANLKAIKTRIESVKSTQKITKAMKMVASVKFRKAQEKLLNARPYSDKLREVIASIAKRTNTEDHKLLKTNIESNNVLFVIFSGDRGLCGAFNGSVTRGVRQFIIENKNNYDKIFLSFIGKKSYEAYKGKPEYNIVDYYEDLTTKIEFDNITKVSDNIVKYYCEKNCKEVYLIYNEFKSVITQKVVMEKILPIEPAKDLYMPSVEYDFEPNESVVLDFLLEKYLKTEIYRALLESSASEQASRMNSMEAASNNAEEMIKELTLTYNRARQSTITKELIEVVSGAEALK